MPQGVNHRHPRSLVLLGAVEVDEQRSGLRGLLLPEVRIARRRTSWSFRL
jgi:hypothetical protein